MDGWMDDDGLIMPLNSLSTYSSLNQVCRRGRRLLAVRGVTRLQKKTEQIKINQKLFFD